MQRISKKTSGGFMPIWVYLISISMLMAEYELIPEMNRNIYFKSRFVPLWMKSIRKIILLKPYIKECNLD